MLAEHIIYSAAIAILVGMLFYRFTGRDSSWIIILCAFAPDIDFIANRVLTRSGFTLLFEGHTISHGVFHNIAIMVIFGILVAFLLHPFGIRFFDAFFFSVIGFGAHLFEDALVYDPGYAFLWPLSSKVLGLRLLPNMINEENYMRDFFWHCKHRCVDCWLGVPACRNNHLDLCGRVNMGPVVYAGQGICKIVQPVK